jgi:hypothetical protein
MRNLDKIFKVVAFLLLLLLSITSKAQVPLYQLEYAIDSNYVIGALPSGEPVWVHRDSLGFGRIYDYNQTSIYYYDIPNPQKGDIYVDDQYDTGGKVWYYDGSDWVIFDYDSRIGNEGELSLRNSIAYWNRVGIRSTGLGSGSEVGVQGDTLIRVSYDEIVPILRLKIDTTTLLDLTTQYLNPYIMGPDTVGFYLTIAQDTVLFVATADTTAGTVDIVTGTSPIIITGDATHTPNVTIQNATTSQSGALTSTDWNTFNNKFNLPSLTNGSVLFSNGTTIAQDNANLFWDNTGKRLLIKDIPITSYAAGQASIGEEAGINSSGATGSYLFGYRAGYAATNALNSNMFGVLAGYNATNAAYSNMFGPYAGYNATNASYSNMFGPYAGNGATNASSSNFFGNNAGKSATNASSSNFFGNNAGNGATGSDNANFFGSFAGSGATNALHSIFIGNSSGINAVSANFSTFLGASAGNGASNASFSTLIGRSAGRTFTDNNIGANNIIIGTNISLPNAAANMMNLGGVLFGTGFYDNIWTDPKIVPTVGGKIGVMTVTPVQTLDITGTTRITGSDGTSTTIMGRDGDGDVSAITASNGITLASNTLKADTSVLATQYDLTTIAPGIDSTYLKSGWGITVDSVGNTYTAKADTSKLATQYDLTQVAGSSKVIDILGSDFTTSATSLQSTALTYTFPSTGTYEIKVYGSYTCSNTANGINVGFIDSGGLVASYITGKHSAFTNNTSSGTTETRKPISAIGTMLSTASVFAASTAYTLISEALITVSTAGTITLGFASGSGSYSATLQAGSSLIVEKLN